MLIKKEQVRDRSDLSWQEAIDFMRVSMAVGRAMYEVLGVERMNYEDLGNWGVDDPGGPKMHLHFFGRARKQTHQIRGHHMFLYPKGHPIYQGHLKPFTAEDIQALRNKVAEILREDKYRKMASLAGIELAVRHCAKTPCN
jgi:diadenosine tetraphosphate (Ap4A) HIT family hydrolase